MQHTSIEGNTTGDESVTVNEASMGDEKGTNNSNECTDDPIKQDMAASIDATMPAGGGTQAAEKGQRKWGVSSFTFTRKVMGSLNPLITKPLRTRISSSTDSS